MAAPASTSAMMGPPMALARPARRASASSKALPSSGADRRSAGIPASALAVPSAPPPPPARGGAAGGRATSAPPSPAPNHDTPPPGVSINTDVMIPPAGGRLHSGCTAFVECHRVRGGEVGPDQTATIATMANLLQVRGGGGGECVGRRGGAPRPTKRASLFLLAGARGRVLPPRKKRRGQRSTRARALASPPLWRAGRAPFPPDTPRALRPIAWLDWCCPPWGEWSEELGLPGPRPLPERAPQKTGGGGKRSGGKRAVFAAPLSRASRLRARALSLSLSPSSSPSPPLPPCSLPSIPAQEVASNHAVAIWGRSESGFAADPMMSAAGLIFALTRLQIQIDAYPKWGEIVSVETWFQEEGRVSASRHWVIRNPTSGAEIGRATSTWVMVDTRSRRLVKMPEPMRLKLESLSPTPPRLALPADQARLRIPDLMLSVDEAGSPPLLEGPKQVARRADMDMNGHINNVTYLAWALEMVPEDVHARGHLAQVELDYKSECLAGQTVESLAAPWEGGVAGLAGSEGDGRTRFLHTLRRCDEEGCYELVRARTTWVMP